MPIKYFTNFQDIWAGTALADSVDGLHGDDILYAGGGDETVYAGGGDDIVFPSSGRD